MGKMKMGPQTLLFPMPAVLVGAQVAEKPNFMTAAWCAIAACCCQTASRGGCIAKGAVHLKGR